MGQARRLSNLKKAKDHISFLQYERLNCYHDGLKHIFEDHDITLMIPEGAVDEGKNVYFEVGVAMYGPFIFPENTQPISPILWLYALEDVRMNEWFQLILPHCYTGSIVPPEQISFVIADQNSTDIVDGQAYFLFELWERSTKCFYKESYGAIQTNFCNHIFCIVKHTKYDGHWCQDLSFSLARIDLRLSQTVQEFRFYGIFDLSTQRKALQAKLQKRGQEILSFTQFQFSCEKLPPFIKLVPLTTDWIVLLHPVLGDIQACDINYWNLSFRTVKAQVEQGSYPPKIRMQVFHTGSGTFPITFMGCTSLEYHLLLPAIVNSIHAHGEDQVREELRSLATCEVRDIDQSYASAEGFMPRAETRPPQTAGGACGDDIQDSRFMIQHVHQSTYFCTAEREAHVPFLDHQLLECDCNGREYTNVDHDITLRILEGAVAEGEKVHFEVGVAMYGPFIFPENTQPISPILWLCLLEEDVELKKPFQIILPHYLTGLRKERIEYHQVRFAKANHSEYTCVGNQMSYKFQNYDTKPQFASSGYKSYGVLESKHCCFYCLEAKVSSELAMDAGYCLVRIESCITPQRNEIVFSPIYFLDTCYSSLKEQFPQERGYEISQCKMFKFRDNDNPLIKVTAVDDQDQCQIGFQPSNAMVKASEISFWEERFEIMQRKHERNMYPPRVKMTVNIREPNITVVLPVRFTGCTTIDGSLDIDLTLPLRSIPSLSPTSSVSSASPMDTQSHTIKCGKPEVAEAFRQLLPISKEWENIGTLLIIPVGTLDNISADKSDMHSRLRAMLIEWLKQVNPPPTWAQLADAVEPFDQAKAKELRTRYVDLTDS